VDQALFTADSQWLIANCFGEKSHVARILRVGGEQPESVVRLALWDTAFMSFDTPRSFLPGPDSKTLAFIAPKSGEHPYTSGFVLKIWDLAGGRERARLDESEHEIRALAYSADGRWLAANIATVNKQPALVKIWDAETGKLVHKLVVPPVKTFWGEPFNADINALLFSADGSSLIGMSAPKVSGVKQQLLCWDLKAGTPTCHWLTDQIDVSDPGNLTIHRVGTNRQIPITSPSHLLSIAHLCELAEPDPRLQQSFGSMPVLTADHQAMAVDNGLSGAGGLFALMTRPGQQQVNEPSTITLIKFDDLQPRALCAQTGLAGNLYPVTFSPDSRSLAVACYYTFTMPFRNDWYKPVLAYLLEPERALQIYDVASGRRLARLLGTDARFTPDGSALVTYEIEAPNDPAASQKQSIGTVQSGHVRVYDYPLRTPWVAILGWALIPALVVFVLRRLWQGWRQSRAARLSAAK
jgi:WD40 repeat protein